MGIERPVRDIELEPDYPKYADLYYGEEGDDEIPDYSHIAEEEAFSAAIFGDGFFEDDEESDTAIETPAAVPAAENNTNNNKADEPAEDKSSQQPEGGSFTVKI